MAAEDWQILKDSQQNGILSDDNVGPSYCFYFEVIVCEDITEILFWLNV